MRLIKLGLFLMTIFCVQLFGVAQVSVNIPGISGSLIKPDMLWNVIVINSGEPFFGTVQLSLSDRNNNNLITATSSEMHFTKGAKAINFNNASPVVYSLNVLGNGNSWLKVGKYFVCYGVKQILHANFGNQVAQECTELNVEPLSPPILTEPVNKDTIYETRPSFSWIPPTPLQIFTDLNYEIKVVELNAGQSPLQAINNNSPIYFDNGLAQPSKVLPASFSALQPNHSYVWQVTAYDPNYSIKSEYWQFRVAKDSVQEIIDRSPYVRLTSEKGNVTSMQQGNLKVVIDNNVDDLSAQLCLSEEGNTNCLVQITIPLKPGENYFQKDLGKVKLDEKKIYKLEWVDSRNEKFYLRFKPVYYK